LFSQPVRSTDVEISLELTYAGAGDKVVLLGSADQSHLAANKMSLKAGLANQGGAGDLYLELGLPDWSLVIDAGEGDAFIQKILSALPLEVGGSLLLGVSLSKGFYIDSAAGLSLLIPLHKTLGPFYVDHAALSLGLEPSALHIETALTGSVTLGPFVLVLENIGLSSGLDWDAPVVELRVDIAGTANLTEGTLKVDASLRDSEVAGLALSGDLAVRASFVDNPSFLFSFGGFHPAFTPPQGFPKLARLGIGLDIGDELRVTLGGYFAVSSSTLQFGAICELWAKAVGFTAEGGTSFDALIVFKPFGFIIALKAWVSISSGEAELLGVLLTGELQGPNRWHVVGLATFKLLGVKKSLEVEARFGRAEDEEPRKLVDVEGLLVEALRDPAAWSVVPVTGAYSGVVLAEMDTESLRVHPAGAIEVRQRIVPLQRRIDHYANARLSGPDEFVLKDARMGPRKVAATDVEDWFAASQSWEMKDAERLSAPSFELMPAGVRLEGGGMIAGDVRRFTADYEVKVRDPAVRGAGPQKPGTVVPARTLQRRSRTRTRPTRPLGAMLPGQRGSRRGPQVAEVTFVDMNIRTGRSEGGGVRADRFYVVRERIGRSAGPLSPAVVPAYELEIE
jgi:hypothetical protein